MKICILGHFQSNNGVYAGVSRVVYNLSHALCAQNNNVTVMKKKRYLYFLKRTVRKEEEEEEEEEGTLSICSASHFDLIFHLINEKYDIINVHNMSSYFIVPFVLKKFHLINSKVVFVSHGIVDIEKDEKRYNYPLRYLLYQKLSLNSSDHIVAVSSYLKEKIQDHYQIEKKKITVIGNAVDNNFFQNEKIANSLQKENYMLFVGEIAKIKGLDFLFENINGVDINFVMVGKKSPYFNELRGKYPELFKSGKVVLLSNLSENDLKSVYSNSRFCILLSKHEPYGMVVLEAMAAEKPVVISDQVGAKEIIEEGKEGFIVPFGDSEYLIEKISQLANNDELVKEMGRLAKKKALQNTWSNKAKEYQQLFECL